MLFTIMGYDVENSLERRMKVRSEHLKRLQKLNEEGRLVLAGPHPHPDNTEESKQFTGSLIVADFESLEAAQAWAKADPYIDAGVYAKVDIKPFIKALPK